MIKKLLAFILWLCVITIFTLIIKYPYEPPKDDLSENIVADDNFIVEEQKIAEIENISPTSITVVATAYCPCKKCCGKTDGITASGEKAVEGVTIAADWNVLPKGTRVYIDGMGIYTVQDTGGNIKGNRIDIFFENHDAALEFGRREIKIIIMEDW